MLTDNDLRCISDGFSVYDHEWRAYVPVFGEPFLIGDWLTYFDGACVYVCAYRVGGAHDLMSKIEALELLSARPEFARAIAVAIWGPFEDFDELTSRNNGNARALPRITFSDFDTSMVDSVIDLASFSYERERRARHRASRVARSSLDTAVVQREELNAEHLALIELWAREHPISRYHGGLAAAVSAYVGDPRIHLVEAREAGELLGFGVLSKASSERVVLLQQFQMRRPHTPIGDAVYCALIAWAQEFNISYIHCGYSTTPSLRFFKRAWGASDDRPPFREAFFTADKAFGEFVERGEFCWQQRVSAVAAAG